MSERDIFDAALAIDDPVQRAAFLDRVCAGDLGLRRHLDGLLSMHGQVGSFLESPALTGAATVELPPVGEGPGTVIGAYKLLEPIGEGGFGIVFLAEQHEPIRRKVALKILKPGMDSKQVIARFEAERQALALMDHPHIAKVLDAGQTDSGRPYFVMDLVKGLPITEFCDQRQLTPRQRLELFVHVCQAVQHAHQKGIIHRDLKPSNVLVALDEAAPQVKVIDFGIAKALGQQLTDKTLCTGLAQMIGTPLYMSPEQTGLGNVDVDTRSDIYSLGVLLYELLTGTTPFDKERFQAVGYDEMRRILREEEPPRPSTRLSTLGQAASTVAMQRKSDVKRLSQLYRGELDWIVMKALEKDRNRRYDTASAFAADVQRYLDDEPVLACPPSAWYRCRKFARRNKRVLITASAFLLLLLASVVGLTIGILALNEERERTQQANANLLNEQAQTKAALTAEEKRRQQAQGALNAMSSPLIDEWLAKQEVLQPKHKKFLEQALKFYEDFAADTGQNETARAGAAAAHLRVGHIRHLLGQLKAAEAAYKRSRELYTGLAEEFTAQPRYRERLAWSQGGLADLFVATGRPKEAEEAYRHAAAIQKQLAADFPRVPEYSVALAKTVCDLATVLEKTGRRDEATETCAQAVAVLKQLVADFSGQPEYLLDLARSHNDHGVYLSNAGRPHDAEKAFRQAIALTEQLPQDFARERGCRTSMANFHNSLGNLLQSTGRAGEAEKAYRQALTIQKQLAADFPALPNLRQVLARSQMNLGVLLEGTRPRDAKEAYAQAITLQKELAADFPTVPAYRHELAMSLFNLGNLLRADAQLGNAEEAFRQALALHLGLARDAPTVPVYQWDLASCRNGLGVVLMLSGRPQDAEEEYHHALAILKPLVAKFPTTPDYQNQLAATMVNLAALLAKCQKFAAARGYFDDALPHHQAALKANPRHPTYRAFLRNNRFGLCLTLLNLKDHAAAADAAAQLLKAAVDPALDPYKAACVLAYCVRLSDGDKQLPEAQRLELAQTYGDRAMAALGQAIAAGYKDTARLKTAPDLEPLRARKDFQKLVAELEAKTKH
jgi:serine/threonine protein kinase/tetratricopeptide (TPR) repeat protein